MNTQYTFSTNKVESFLGKARDKFRKSDIIKFIAENDIRMVNFMYPAGDGRLKTLNFIINSISYLDTLLSCGERVDGSSLFSFVNAECSDLYVIPRFKTAFVDPFSEIPTLNLLCSYFDKDGEPFSAAPVETLHRACNTFHAITGMHFQCMGELEYYVVAPDDGSFPAVDQHGYHESGPFAKFGDFRQQCMMYIAQAGGQIKYGHTEVGTFKYQGNLYEQNEIEFLPVDAEDAADQLVLAKWIIRKEAQRRGLTVTFAPKITTGKAGSGMHIHMRIVKEGKSMMVNRDGTLSDIARRAIAGLMQLAPSITAFGNKNPTSYFRLVPHQEAPTNICWGDMNRSTLVRVPLGWQRTTDMSQIANPLEDAMHHDRSMKQTFEMRSPDGSAEVYTLMAGLAVACRHGLEMSDALVIAKHTYVSVNIHNEENADQLMNLKQLPDSCTASADCLNSQRAIYEQYGVFSPQMIDGVIKELKAFHDRTLRHDISGNLNVMQQLVEKHFHCG
ncbi:MAG: glutamine synthetase family protein [Muribaculaceae bacterium]